MEATGLQRHVRAADLPLDKLAASTDIPKAEKESEVCRQFEAVLLRQVLNENMKPMLGSTLTGTGAVNGIYQDMVVNELADSISKSRTFGLATSLQTQLEGPRLRKHGAADQAQDSSAASNASQKLS